MGRKIQLLLPLVLVLGCIGFVAYVAIRGTVPVLEPMGSIAAQQRNLLLFALGLSLLVVIPVYGMLVLFAYKYRSSKKGAKKSYKPEWGENKVLEAMWWGIPIVIITILSFVTYQTSHTLDPYRAIESSKPILKVHVVALQWKWLFLYPEYNVASLNYVPIAVDRPTEFSLSADAPMSAFWIPSLGSQVYAMNGMTSKVNLMATKPGLYKGYTTNINGEGYARMTFTAKALEETAFDNWVLEAKASLTELNQETYDSLTKPKQDTTEVTYNVADKTLIDHITNQTGMSHSVGSGAHHE